MVFGLITISFWRVVIFKYETLGEVASSMFSQIKCTGSISVVECRGCTIEGVEKGSGDGGCVKIAARPDKDTWLVLRGVFGVGRCCQAVCPLALSVFVLDTSRPHLLLSFSTSTSPSFTTSIASHSSHTDPDLDISPNTLITFHRSHQMFVD
ncbi:uncharacterized protein MONOS_8548 [Monocercomonoides exilis]|uniref:uncharacterized protein n=1 Tax=Monocercomonoides exilis TaxID=2049356 RepID=UPI00355944E6|nr:hypothetical protein MONOS_8548 [Monocercomonoides exilis]|eukprot:MONOS_8548.1-p1 / transcript=MONOS_8548.1 / gene=MONOS_8548 / organism=Monocercomonoides_exilis_PA203 / gene_product=unspecified product / transcript_product=unspecified product / location=Mono_scaffold00325:14122-14577(-) / protein_length=152 / sequence_SO=supercontig / SO=protein_coding / is_pseudo=false